VIVTDTAVTGLAWGEDVGWINLSPATGGVVNDGTGYLSGFAWGENVGWIDFAPVGGGVSTACRAPAQLLTVAKRGQGSVSSDPAGIACGSTCSAAFPFATSVTLTAVPAPGCTFAGWSGGGCDGTGECIVSMTRARSVTAAFLDVTPPTVTHTPLTSGAVNTALLLTATITDNVGGRGRPSSTGPPEWAATRPRP
jgi:List-Bact-rpt repeat protein